MKKFFSAVAAGLVVEIILRFAGSSLTEVPKIVVVYIKGESEHLKENEKDNSGHQGTYVEEQTETKRGRSGDNPTETNQPSPGITQNKPPIEIVYREASDRNSSSITSYNGAKDVSIENMRNPAPEETLDYSNFVNRPSQKTKISVLIMEGENIDMSLSNEIAKLYRAEGIPSSISLLKNTFIHRSEFQDLKTGDADIMKKLQLNTCTEFLAIGNITYNYRNSSLVYGSIVCNSVLTVNIISTSEGSIMDSFTISDANGNGVTNEQAKQFAINTLLNKYYTNHTKI